MEDEFLEDLAVAERRRLRSTLSRLGMASDARHKELS
jgi:hypothetical protein